MDLIIFYIAFGKAIIYCKNILLERAGDECTTVLAQNNNKEQDCKSPFFRNLKSINHDLMNYLTTVCSLDLLMVKIFLLLVLCIFLRQREKLKLSVPFQNYWQDYDSGMALLLSNVNYWTPNYITLKIRPLSD